MGGPTDPKSVDILQEAAFLFSVQPNDLVVPGGLTFVVLNQTIEWIGHTSTLTPFFLRLSAY